MKAKVSIITVIIIIAASIILSACVRNYEKNPAKMTIEQSDNIVQTYFEETYGKNVTVISIEYKQTGNYRYRNLITVTDGETEYRLVLDEKNKPFFDNVLAIDTIKTIDPYSFENKLQPLGLKLHEAYDLSASFNGLNSKYDVSFRVITDGLPSKDAKDGIYLLLTELKDEGIDNFVITIHTPYFLCPSLNDRADPEASGIQLSGEWFDTDVGRAEFEIKYDDFVDSVYWNQQKFDDKILELTQLGYRNAMFISSGWYDGLTVEIVLHCESDSALSGEQAQIMLENMDDSYFRISDKKIRYTLEHIQKG